MKILRLSIGQIKAFWTNNTVVFVLFAIGTVISALVFIYAYGNIMPEKRRQAQNFVYHRTFSVAFAEAEALDEAYLHLLDSYGIQDVWLDHITDLYIPAFNQHLALRAFLYNNRETEIVFTPLFSDQELTGNNIIISPDHEAKTMFQVSGLSFRIVRKVGNLSADLAFIPFSAFMRNQIKADMLSFTLEKVPDANTCSAIRQTLESTFPNAQIRSADAFFAYSPSDNVTALLMICTAYLLSVSSFLFLFTYLFRSNTRDILVYRYLGMRRKNIISILIIQLLSLTTAAFLLALVLHRMFYGLFDRFVNLYTDIQYYPFDYFLILLLSLFLSGIAILPFVLRYALKNEHPIAGGGLG